MTKLSKDFYDTVDFEKFLCHLFLLYNKREIEIRELMDKLEYHFNGSNILPPEFQGEFFNFIDEYEFSEYLKERYGYKITTRIIEKNILSKDQIVNLKRFKEECDSLGMVYKEGSNA